MRGSKSVFRLLPVLAFVVISTPSSMDVARAQVDAARNPRGFMFQNDTPAQRKTPGLTNDSVALDIEVFNGTSVERVSVRSGDPIAATDDPSADDPGDLSSQIELFKGGDVMLLTVAEGAESMPVAARVDSVKRNPVGPVNLLPFLPRSDTENLRAGPTDLIALQPAAAAVTFRKGPTSLVRLRPRAAGAGLAGAPTSDDPSPSPVAGVGLRDDVARDGILVESIGQSSPAWQDGLRQADVITAVNRTPVHDIAALESALASADATVVLEVRRGDDAVIVVLHR